MRKVVRLPGLLPNTESGLHFETPGEEVALKSPAELGHTQPCSEVTKAWGLCWETRHIRATQVISCFYRVEEDAAVLPYVRSLADVAC